MCMSVCVDCNTVAVYPGPSSKQLVPICSFFCRCGLRLMRRCALACGVWVWTNGGEACTAAGCVCMYDCGFRWPSAPVCICGFALDSCMCVYVDRWCKAILVDYTSLCVHLAQRCPLHACMVWLCVCLCVRWLVIITLWFHLNIIDRMHISKCSAALLLPA